MIMIKSKKQVLAFYSDLLKNYYNETNSIDLTLNYLEQIKLNENNYNKIKKILFKEKEYKIFVTETEQIINIFKNKIRDYKIETSQEELEPTIYFHLKNSQTYLINYDTVEKRWYLSLIETNSYTLIKEIYNDEFKNFLLFLRKNKFN